MLNVMVTGLLCISMLLVASSCNLCLFTVKFYWNIRKKKKKMSMNISATVLAITLTIHTLKNKKLIKKLLVLKWTKFHVKLRNFQYYGLI